MSFTKIIAAASIVASLGVSTVAGAQETRREMRHEIRQERHEAWRHGNAYGHRNHWHNRCTMQWRHHHQVRVCR